MDEGHFLKEAQRLARRDFLKVAVAGSVMLLGGGPAHLFAQERKRVSVVTGGMGGVYFVMGGGIASLITKYGGAEAAAEVVARAGEDALSEAHAAIGLEAHNRDVEPTTNLDPAARKALWEVLNREYNDRFTSPYPWEAAAGGTYLLADVASTSLGNGSVWISTEQVIAAHHLSHEDAAVGQDGGVAIADQLLVNDLPQICVGRIHPDGRNARLLAKGDQRSSGPEGFSIEADLIRRVMLPGDQPVPGTQHILKFLVADGRAAVVNI